MKTSKNDRIFYAICYAVILLLTLSVLYPILYIISSSFSSPDAVVAGKVKLLPVEPSLEGYRAVFRYKEVWMGYGNTIFYTVVGTFVNVAMTMICAYPLARTNLRGRGVITFLFTFTMIFSGGMIPNYLLMRGLGLLNTRWAMILPGAMSVYNMIVARTFIQSNISGDILEAAKLDGCSDCVFFFRIILPLSKSIIAVLSLWYAVGHWNAYFNAFLYLSDRNLYPLQIFLKNILVQSQMSAAMVESGDAVQVRNTYVVLKYALIVVATLPLFFFYPFVQKHFVKGVMVGSVKG